MATTIDQTITYLEMTAPEHLLAADHPSPPLELELQPGGAVEIMVFGLLPEFVGRALGGHLLTAAAHSAWEARAPGHPRTRRVWLHTSSLDHPHALRNYERRGFRVFRRVSRPRPVPD